MQADDSAAVALAGRQYGQWFPELDSDARVSRLVARQRPQSRLEILRIDDGHLDRTVVVKQNRLTTPVVTRPRLGLTDRFEDKHRFEAAALQAIARDLDDEFNTIRVVDVADDLLALELMPGRPLNRRLRHPGFDASSAVADCGRWLRRFHALALDPPTAAVRADAAEVEAAFSAYRTFLAAPLERSGLGDRLAATTDRFVDGLDRLPPTLGLQHGDFAPRNVLVDDTSGLGVIDPLGVQRAPVHEDLAYFAVSLERGPLLPLVGVAASRRARRLEQRLLEGYGLDRREAWTYEGFAVLVVLDMWAADISRAPSRPSIVTRAATRVLPTPARLLNRRLNRFERARLDERTP